jgi:hypothetical protein
MKNKLDEWIEDWFDCIVTGSIILIMGMIALTITVLCIRGMFRKQIPTCKYHHVEMICPDCNLKNN